LCDTVKANFVQFLDDFVGLCVANGMPLQGTFYNSGS